MGGGADEAGGRRLRSRLQALVDLVSVLDSVLFLQLLRDIRKPEEQRQQSTLSRRTLLT